MNYWLSPSGEYKECKLGDHFTVGMDLIEKYYELEAKEKSILDENGCFNAKINTQDVIEFLEHKGWLRYYDYTNHIMKKLKGWVIPIHKRPTKRQIEMMYELTGYYYNK